MTSQPVVQYKLCCFDVKDNDGFTIDLFGIDEQRVFVVVSLADDTELSDSKLHDALPKSLVGQKGGRK